MLDRNAFNCPIAHRGLHDGGASVVENTGPAFSAAIAKGVGIECDLRAAEGALPIVFHDTTLDRVVEGSGPVTRLTRTDLKSLRHKSSGAPIMTFGELLEMVGGSVPLLVEVKGEWERPNIDFLRQIADLTWRYRGPLALMSFDPAMMTAIGAFAPGVPRGIVSGIYRNDDPEGWWGDILTPERQERLSHFLESRPAAPDFYAYDVKSLPTPVTRFVREVVGLPLFTWTVRSAEDRAIAKAHADVAIFEGEVP